jgi:cyclophilin family peptidyl-prolyl cis-trans isomerase
MSASSLFRLPRWHQFPVGLTGALALLFAIVGCSKPAETPETTSANKSAVRTGSSATNSTPPKVVDRKHPVVRIETNLGAIVIRLDAEKSPGTVRNFLNYVNEGFYKNTIIHVVDADKMIMGGGYSTDHQLKTPHSELRNEAHNGLKNVRGTIAMARNPALIDSANSQFFINLQDAPQRDHSGDTPDKYGYCVFGQVTEGLDVAEKISRTPTADMSSKSEDLAATPKTPVVISSMQVVM